MAHPGFLRHHNGNVDLSFDQFFPLAFNLVARQQWNFPSHAGTLYLHLRITSVCTLVVVASSNQLKPVWSSLVCLTKNSIAWV